MNPQNYAAATHELVNHTGHVLAVGTQKQCMDAMVNIYGDAPVFDLVKQGVRIVKL